MQERLRKIMLVCSILFSVVSMSVMLHFSATKLIVIAEEAAPEQAADKERQDGEKNALHFAKGAETDGIEIPLPSEIRADDIVIENRYIEHSIHIILTGEYGSFYRTNALFGNDRAVEGGFLSEEDGKTRLRLQMTGLYEHQYMFENGMLQLFFEKPSSLYDKIVVLDAAHGGGDSGNTGNGISEKTLALAITEKVREKLKDTDIRIYCTRTDDAEVAEEERARFANELSADLLISVRAGFDMGNEKVFGIQTFYDASYFIPYFGNIELADLLERSAVTAVGGKANGLFAAAEEDVLLQNAQMPTAAIEIGYLSNREETAKLMQPDYQDRLAEGIAAAIREAFAEIEKNS